jgi:hypothetical protein
MRNRVALLVALTIVGSVVMLTAQTPSPGGATDTPLATRELDVEGIVAEVIESVRTNNMLSVRVRFRNTGTVPAKISLAGGGVSYHIQNYIVAGDTKYEIMRDTAGKVLATPTDGGGWITPTIKPKGTFMWWANYPAPPATEKSYTLYLKEGPPIPDVPIIDK